MRPLDRTLRIAEHGNEITVGEPGHSQIRLYSGDSLQISAVGVDLELIGTLRCRTRVDPEVERQAVADLEMEALAWQ